MRSNRLFRASAFGLAATGVLLLDGCGKPKPPPMGPPEVGVVTLQPQSVTLSTTLSGRTTPYAVSDVRPQVNGIIQSRLFVEGSNVRAGQVLYQIDPAPYRASFDQAKAQVAQAQATLATNKVKAERYAELVKINGVSKQDYDDANAAYLQAAATVQQNQALLQTARINLDYTAVKAPISGRVGVSAFTKGALVTSGQTSALTTVQTLDPIYVDITQSAAELLTLRKNLADGALTKGGPASAEVSLKLEDGSDYPAHGKLLLTDVTVDQTTGAVTLRAIFPNPKGVLLPGMFVRAVVIQGDKSAAILAPQQGVTRDQAGRPTAMVVDAQGKAQARMVTTAGVVGDKWLITSGLAAGDKLIVEGLQRVKPGTPVHAVPAGSAPPNGQPQQGAAQQGAAK
jgi:membrane fusion protein (multidrug efflux system)